MAGEYITEGQVPTAAEVLQEMIDEYQALVPGWVPYEGNPVTTLFAIQAQRDVVLLDMVANVKAQIFTEFGVSIGQVPFRAASYATVDATVTIGAAFTGEPHTIPAGLRVQLPGSEEPAGFQVAEDVTVSTGEATAVVTLRAEQAGSQASGLTGEVSILDPRQWIQGITLNSETAGGEDAESEAKYRDRLVRKERRDSDTIITAVDAEEAILEIPGIGRCLIIDNYVPKKGGEAAKTGVAGAFTAVVMDPAGADVSGTIKAEALALVVEAFRLLGLQGYIIDPTRTPIAVAYSFTTLPGWEQAAVKAAADAAVTAALSPPEWGLITNAAGVQEWEEDLLVRYGELYGVLDNVDGLKDVNTLTINTLAHTDAALTGPGALPELTSVAGTAE